MNILSTLVQNLYHRLNASDTAFAVEDPLSSQIVSSKDYFENCCSNEGLPHESRYVRINRDFLPKIVFSAYYLTNDKNHPPENICLSFRGHIDIDQLDDVLLEEGVKASKVPGKRYQEYRTEDGDPLLRIVSNNEGIRRVLFLPEYHEQRGYSPRAEALDIVSLLYERQCFISIASLEGGQGGMRMTPVLTLAGELDLIPQQVLRQEIQQISSRVGFARTLRMSREELQRYASRVVPPRKP